MENSFQIRQIIEADMPVILSLIWELAEYERAPDAVVASETGLREVLFGAQRPGIQIFTGARQINRSPVRRERRLHA
jgi:hypothetical protein